LAQLLLVFSILEERLPEDEAVLLDVGREHFDDAALVADDFDAGWRALLHLQHVDGGMVAPRKRQRVRQRQIVERLFVRSVVERAPFAPIVDALRPADQWLPSLHVRDVPLDLVDALARVLNARPEIRVVPARLDAKKFIVCNTEADAAEIINLKLNKTKKINPYG
jgi:hypothetical protein